VVNYSRSELFLGFVICFGVEKIAISWVSSADDFSRKLLAADVGTVTLDKSIEVENKVVSGGLGNLVENWKTLNRRLLKNLNKKRVMQLKVTRSMIQRGQRGGVSPSKNFLKTPLEFYRKMF
jgi:hypothetical protein